MESIAGAPSGAAGPAQLPAGVMAGKGSSKGSKDVAPDFGSTLLASLPQVAAKAVAGAARDAETGTRLRAQVLGDREGTPETKTHAKPQKKQSEPAAPPTESLVAAAVSPAPSPSFGLGAVVVARPVVALPAPAEKEDAEPLGATSLASLPAQTPVAAVVPVVVAAMLPAPSPVAATAARSSSSARETARSSSLAKEASPTGAGDVLAKASDAPLATQVPVSGQASVLVPIGLASAGLVPANAVPVVQSAVSASPAPVSPAQSKAVAARTQSSSQASVPVGGTAHSVPASAPSPASFRATEASADSESLDIPAAPSSEAAAKTIGGAAPGALAASPARDVSLAEPSAAIADKSGAVPNVPEPSQSADLADASSLAASVAPAAVAGQGVAIRPPAAGAGAVKGPAAASRTANGSANGLGQAQTATAAGGSTAVGAHTGLGQAGGATQGAASDDRSGGPAARISTADVFRQIDSGSPASVVSSHGSSRTVEVGVNDPAHGWIEVRAQGAAGQVSASLGAATPEAHAALRAELPGMTQYLAERELGVRSLDVGVGSGGSQAPAGGDRSGQQSFTGGNSESGARGASDSSFRSSSGGNRSASLLDPSLGGAASGHLISVRA